MTIDEAIGVAEMEIEILRQGAAEPEPYDLLRICQCLLNAIQLIKEGVSELNPD